MPGSPAPKVRFSILGLVAAVALIVPAVLGASAAHADDPTSGLVSGHITDATTHAPIAGAAVTVRTDLPPGGSPVDVLTDVNGYYEAALPFGGSMPIVSANALGYGSFGDTFTPLSAEAPNAVVDLALPPKDAAVHGTVRDAATHAPIENVAISFSYPSGDESATTDSGGTFSIPNAVADAYYVRFEASGYLTKTMYNVILTAGADIVLDADLTAADATLTGRVVDGVGAGIPGLPVNGEPSGGGGPNLWGLTDSDGYYTVAGFGAGSWKITVGGLYGGADVNGDYWQQDERVVTFDAGETATEDFELTELVFGSVNGTAYDTVGDPLDGICVLAMEDGGDGFAAIGGMFGTDASGYFESTQIPVGVYTLRFYDCGNSRIGTAAKAITYLGDVPNRTHADTFDLGEGETESGLDVHLGVGGQISGTSQVRTPDGSAPLPGIRTLNVRPNLFQEVDGDWEPIPYENSYFGDGDGYVMFGLPPVDICVGFIDTSVGPNAFSPTFYDDADTCDDADLVSVTAGAAVPDITALLSIPRPGDDPEAVDDFSDVAEGSIGSNSEVTQGEETTIGVGEVHAGEWMSAFGHSVPTQLGDWAQVASDGTIRVTVPLTLPAGSHSLVVQSADGAVLGWNPVTVTAAATPGGGTIGSPPAGSGPKTFGTTGASTHVYTLAEIIAKFGSDTEEMLRLYLERTGKTVPDDLASIIIGGDGELDLSDFDAWLRWVGGDSSVEAWSYSTPTYLGTFRVVDGQLVVSDVDLSAAGAGEHHLVLVGQQTGTSVVVTYEVPAVPSESEAETGTVDDPPAAAVEDAPATQPEWGWLLWVIIAVVMVAILLLLVFMARRARTG